MANVRIAVSKKGTLIAMIVLVLLLGGGAGYLLWRVNQKDTVAPTDSSASGEWVCDPKFDVVYYLRDGTEKMCNACKSDQKPPVGQGCPSGPYLYECGEYCFPEGEYACGKEACDNISNPAPTVTLTYTADPGAGGSIIGKATQTFRKGGDGEQVEARPNQGYNFDGWSDGTPSSKRRDTNVNASATYTANFTSTGTPDPVTYTLEIRVSPAGGGKVLDGDGVDITGKKYVNLTPGSQIWNRAAPNSGYKFVKWLDGKTDNPRVELINSNMVLTATFEALPADKVTLTYVAGTGGSITGIKVQTVSKGGSGTPVTAVADNGYVFDGWCEDASMTVCVMAADSGPGGQPGTGGATRVDSNVQANATYWARFRGENGVPVGGDTVPQTGLFDETKNIVIMGVVLLVLGITWTWLSRLPKKAYTSIKTVSKASSEYISNVKVQKERNIRESRRNRLEKRIK